MTTLVAAENFASGAVNAQLTELTVPQFDDMSLPDTSAANGIIANDYALPGLTRSAKWSGTAFRYGIINIASHTRHRHRISEKFDSLPPSGTNRIIYQVMVGSNATIAWQLRLTDLGKLVIRDVSTATDTSTMSFVAGDEVDIDIDLDGAGNAIVRLFTGTPDQTTTGQFRLQATAAADETMGNDATQGALTATNFGNVYYGNVTATTGAHVHHTGYSSNITNSEVPTPYAPPATTPADGSMEIMRMVSGVWVKQELLQHNGGSFELMALDRIGDVSAPPGQSISAILEPNDGAWFGAETPVQNGTGATLQGLQEWESQWGRTPDILHEYKQETYDGRIGAAMQSQLVRAGKPRPILLTNWKIRLDSQDWNNIAAGDYDAQIDQCAAGLRARTDKHFFTFWHEPEDDVGSGATAANFVSAFEHVVTRLRGQGVAPAAQGGNTVIVLNPMGYRGWGIDGTLEDVCAVNSSYFDWFAWNPYAIDPGRYTVSRWIDDYEGAWDGTYTWAMAHPVLSTKPFMLCEWGVNHGSGGFSQSEESAFYSAMPATLEASYPNIKAYVHWNGTTESRNGRNYQTHGRTTALVGAKECARSAYFNTARLDQIPGRS